MESRNSIPTRKPTAAGMTAHLPLLLHESMAGISSDHTDADTITPDANPSMVFCASSGILSRMKKTKAEPSIVPSSGMSSPMIIVAKLIYIILNKISTCHICSFSRSIFHTARRYRTQALLQV